MLYGEEKRQKAASTFQREGTKYRFGGKAVKKNGYQQANE